MPYSAVTAGRMKAFSGSFVSLNILSTGRGSRIETDDALFGCCIITTQSELQEFGQDFSNSVMD